MILKIQFLILSFIITSILCAQDYTIIRDVSYTETSVSEKQKLDIYIPETDELKSCLVWIHGGAWQFGSKDELAPEIDTLLYHAYVIVSIGYRLSGEAIFPAQIYDCKAAIRFLKENAVEYEIDSSRIAVAGASAGGHLAALLGTSGGLGSLEDKAMGSPQASSRVNAVVDFYGPTNFLIMDDIPDINNAECEDHMIHLEPHSPESLLLGCNLEDCPRKVKRANPLTYISDDDPPFLIFHGENDCTVTLKCSVLLAERLTKYGVYVDFNILPDTGHGGDEFLSSEIKTKLINFLDNTLK